MEAAGGNELGWHRTEFRGKTYSATWKTQMSFSSAIGCYRGIEIGIIETALPLIFGRSLKVAGGKGHVSWIKAFSVISPRLSVNLD